MRYTKSQYTRRLRSFFLLAAGRLGLAAAAGGTGLLGGGGSTYELELVGRNGRNKLEFNLVVLLDTELPQSLLVEGELHTVETEPLLLGRQLEENNVGLDQLVRSRVGLRVKLSSSRATLDSGGLA